jgi:hypothetical protein
VNTPGKRAQQAGNRPLHGGSAQEVAPQAQKHCHYVCLQAVLAGCDKKSFLIECPVIQCFSLQKVLFASVSWYF